MSDSARHDPSFAALYRTSRKAPAFLALAAGINAVAALVPYAHAQWTVTNLEPDAGAQLESQAFGVSGTQQVGVAGNWAALWSGTAASWVSINPSVAGFSQINGVSGTQQVGWAHIISANSIHAGRWAGTAASWVDLNPPGAFNSEAFATTGSQQVGRAFINGRERAVLWSGTAASWVDLSPAVANESKAFAISGTRQAGYIISNTSGAQLASVWSGSAGSWVNLNPSFSSNSMAYGISGTQQVGFASTFDYGHSACVWSGSAGSWADLGHLATGSDLSEARATNGSLQVGYARFEFEFEHACVWYFPTENWVDLHALLPANFRDSAATGVWSDATHDYVSGYGYNNATERYEALLWTRNGGACTSPTIDSSPQSANICAEYGAQFLVYPSASSTAPLTYQWQWQPVGVSTWTVLTTGVNNHPVTGQPAFRALDATTAHIIILPPYSGASGLRLRAIVSNACGSATSGIATLTLNSADFNNDGDVGTDQDIEAFFRCLAGTCCPACGSADFNSDGDVGTDQDIEAFFRILAGGSC